MVELSREGKRDISRTLLLMVFTLGLSVLHVYGDITYLVIFGLLLVFLSIRPNGLMGKPWG